MKISLNKTTVVLAAAMLSAPQALLAQPGPMPFSAFDSDNSGTISAQEYSDFHAQGTQSLSGKDRLMRGAADAPAFADVDTDNDGQISADELRDAQRARFQQRRGHRMAPGNKGGRGMQRGMGMRDDGGMYRPQQPGQFTPGRRDMARFNSFDLNRDGVVSEREFNQLRARRQAERARQGYPMRNRANAPQFSDFDSNNNGVISAREFADFAERRYRQRWQQR